MGTPLSAWGLDSGVGVSHCVACVLALECWCSPECIDQHRAVVIGCCGPALSQYERGACLGWIGKVHPLQVAFLVPCLSAVFHDRVSMGVGGCPCLALPGTLQGVCFWCWRNSVVESIQLYRLELGVCSFWARGCLRLLA